MRPIQKDLKSYIRISLQLTVFPEKKLIYNKVLLSLFIQRYANWAIELTFGQNNKHNSLLKQQIITTNQNYENNLRLGLKRHAKFKKKVK